MSQPHYCIDSKVTRNAQINELVYLCQQEDQEAFTLLFSLMAPVYKFVFATKQLHPLMSYPEWKAEALLMLQHTLWRWRPDQDTQFKTMYRRILDNRAQDILRQSSTSKNKSLIYAVPLEFSVNQHTGCYSGEKSCAQVYQAQKEQNLRSIHAEVISRLEKTLSDEEMKILLMIQEGFQVAQAARKMNISRTKVYKILEKSRHIVHDLTPYIADAIV